MISIIFCEGIFIINFVYYLEDVDMFLKTIRKTQEDYKVNITSPQILRMPQSFKNFYSGGPQPSSSNDEIFVIFYDIFLPFIIFKKFINFKTTALLLILNFNEIYLFFKTIRLTFIVFTN